MIDAYPNDEEMAERCGCGHTLGQHAYGDDMAPCDLMSCGCRDFHCPSSCESRAKHGVPECEGHALWQAMIADDPVV